MLGDKFIALHQNPGEWVWTAIGERNGQYVTCHGKTPLDAIENLQISLTEVEVTILV